MGGKAFAPQGLHTPRMPPHIYHKVLAQVQSKLRTVYARAETPIEGPGKTDHGDIDVLVLIDPNSRAPTVEEVAVLLGAEHFLGAPGWHFALPWPEGFDGGDDGGDRDGHDRGNDRGAKGKDGDEDEVDYIIDLMTDTKTTDPQYPLKRHIQVDININTSLSTYTHLLFMHAHSDLFSILGTVLRRHHLTPTPDGLCLRIPDLDNTPKSQSRILLISDPDTILDFLGLDVARYKRPFATVDELFDYIATCRFHDPRRGERHDDTKTDTDAVNDSGIGKDNSLGIQAHDRKKLKQRPMFRRWLEEYLPLHRDGPVGSASRLTADEIVENVKVFFGEEVARRYDEMRERGLKARDREKFWSAVRQNLVERGVVGGELTVAMKGLRGVVESAGGDVGRGKVEDDGEGGDRANVEDKFDVKTAYAKGRYTEVRAWMDENWRDVMADQIRRDREKSTAKLFEHLAKEKEKQKQENDSSAIGGEA